MIFCLTYKLANQCDMYIGMSKSNYCSRWKDIILLLISLFCFSPIRNLPWWFMTEHAYMHDIHVLAIWVSSRHTLHPKPLLIANRIDIQEKRPWKAYNTNTSQSQTNSIRCLSSFRGWRPGLLWFQSFCRHGFPCHVSAINLRLIAPTPFHMTPFWLILFQSVMRVSRLSLYCTSTKSILPFKLHLESLICISY